METLKDLTKEQLIDDLIELRRRISELEKIEKDKKKYEEELDRVKAMFEGLFEFAPDAILVVNPEGRIIRVNKQTERLFGYSRNELLDTPLEILLPERLREIHKEHRRKYMAEPHVRPMGRDLELYGRRKDSSEFHVDIALGPIQIEQDILVLAVVRDFTEFKKSEAGRLREKTISDATIDNMPGIFYLLDEQGKLLRWNKNLEQASGYSALEISKMHFVDFFVGQDKETMEQSIAVFTNGHTSVLSH
jgi:PAS domain S-box-containing protein